MILAPSAGESVGVGNRGAAAGGDQGGPGDNSENCLLHTSDNATEKAGRVKHDSCGDFLQLSFRHGFE
jgi:hypothetical protein